MKYLLLFILWFSSQGYSIDWFPLSTVTGQDLNSVFFINADTGWIVGDSGVILNTTNGGENWVKQNSKVTQRLRSVTFMNSNIGWAVGDGGTVLGTQNGGLSWTKKLFLSDANLYSVFFLNGTSIGWAVGSTGNLSQLNSGQTAIFKSIDGGFSWSQQTGGGRGLRSVFFVNENFGWAVGVSINPVVGTDRNPDRFSVILKTSDGGKSWIKQDSSQGGLYSLCNVENKYFWTSGEVIRYSSDSGSTWDYETLSDPKIGTIRSIYFINKNIGYAVGGGGYVETNCIPIIEPNCKIQPPTSSYIKTFDGGRTWKSDSTGTQNTLLSINFPAENVGYTVGTGGAILKFGHTVET